MAMRWSPLGPWRRPSASHFGSSSSSWEPWTRPGWSRASREREGSRRTLSRTVSLRSLTEDAHDGRAAHGALALCGTPAVLQGRLFALELSLGLALHAISLVRRQSIHLLRVLGGPHLCAPSDSLRGRAIGRPRKGFSGQDATSSSTPGLAPP